MTATHHVHSTCTTNGVTLLITMFCPVLCLWTMHVVWVCHCQDDGSDDQGCILCHVSGINDCNPPHTSSRARNPSPYHYSTCLRTHAASYAIQPFLAMLLPDIPRARRNDPSSDGTRASLVSRLFCLDGGGRWRWWVMHDDSGCCCVVVSFVTAACKYMSRSHTHSHTCQGWVLLPMD